MSRSARTALAVMVVMILSGVLVAATVAVRSATGQAVPQQAAEPAPPEGQTYTGVKDCASCHFKQYLAWKKTGHSKSFDLLPQQYQANPACLKCHTTGFGEPTGYKGPTDVNLQGTTCEVCHGPGSNHSEVCKGFGKEKLTPEQERIARDTIWLMIPKNVCVECHAVQGHGESQTPPELRTKQ